MNNTDQNYTDEFFKQGLSSPPEMNPSDKNWEEMERLLAAKATGRSIAWNYTVSGIAAAILIFISLWIASEKNSSETVRTREVKALKNVPDAGNKAILNQANAGIIQNPPVGSLRGNGIKLRAMPLQAGEEAVNRHEGTSLIVVSTGTGDLPLTGARSAINLVNVASFLTVQPSFTNEIGTRRNIEIPDTQLIASNAVDTETNAPDPRTPGQAGKWALGLALSPDVNSVNSMHHGNLGLSMGIGLSYKLGKALSVGTGLYYSQKQYSANKTSYKVTEKPFATWTSYSKKIDADCRVIDVPVNLSLRISNKTSNKLYASAGMSSYIMLSEKYDFIYNNPSPAFPTGRREYTVRNENKHILNIVNLAVALEKPLSDQVSLVIQPYAKLPLTGIGKGQTDLKSVGIGFGLNYSGKKKR